MKFHSFFLVAIFALTHTMSNAKPSISDINSSNNNSSNNSFITDSVLSNTKQHNAEFCYVPSKNNVSYVDVLGLDTEQPDQILSYGEDPLQYGELWLPSTHFNDKKPPLVILIHGGCWLSAYDIQHTHALSTGLRHSGYAVWAIEYRRTGDAGGGWPGTLDDINTAINKILQRDSNEYDKRNVAIIGHSAGGHLALLAGAAIKNNKAIKAVIGLAAITDLIKYANGDNSCQTVTPKFMGGTPDQVPEKYRAADPRQLKLHGNSILIHGSVDTIVAPAHAGFIPQARPTVVEGAGHFDMLHPGTHSFQELLKQLGKHL